MKGKLASQTTIIGGESGATAVFIAGHGDDFKMPLKDRIRKKYYQIQRRRATKKIKPGAHTKEETIAYAKEKYDFFPVSPTQQKYKNEKKSVREGIIYRYRPELVGEFLHITGPDHSDKESLEEFYRLLEEREKKIEAIPEEEVPMEFQMYELVMEKGHLEMVLEFRWNRFGVSYGGERKQMKKLKRIAQDLYSYYGVTEEDIKNKTERYSALVCALADF